MIEQTCEVWCCHGVRLWCWDLCDTAAVHAGSLHIVGLRKPAHTVFLRCLNV